MALLVTTISVSQSLGSATFFGSWNGGGGLSNLEVWFEWGYGSFTFNTPRQDKTGINSGNYSATESVSKDRVFKFRAKAESNLGFAQGITINGKTYADPAIFTGLFPGTPTTTECTVSGSVTPNIIESSGAVNIQYRKQGTATWIDLATLVSLSPGAGPTALGGTIAGLDPATAYEARYRIIRDTANNTTAFSNIGTFTTKGSTPVLVGAPLIAINIEVFPPTTVAGALSVTVPLMEISIGVFVPSINISQARVVQMTVVMADKTEIEMIMD